ncbi:papain-like cysteine protease family protein [Cryptosporangium minutisporangium]|uniref:Peptidase C39-like domain-containing protein n=1 Tax=Cryptosporangium minutisporangium TaxID=113569 RepID=A0ABP6T666_9ACTN
MTSALREQLGIGIDAQSWDVDDFRLWASNARGVVLYAPTSLRLGRNSTGRPAAAVTQNLRWRDGIYQSLGGSATLGFFDDDLSDVDRCRRDREWRRVVCAGASVADAPSFVPLEMRDLQLTATVDRRSARLLAPELTSTRTATFELTAAGASEWVAAVTDGGAVAGSIRMSYRYPRLLKPGTVTITIHGAQVFNELARQLGGAVGDPPRATAARIADAWSSLFTAGALGLSIDPPTTGERADGLMDQVHEELFSALFVPVRSDGQPAGKYELRWRHPSDVPDTSLSVSAAGWTWVTAALDCELSTLLRTVDPADVLTTYATASVPTRVVVESAAEVSSVEVSLDFGDGRPPAVFTCDGSGMTRQVAIAAERPEQVTATYHARVLFADPDSSAVEVAGVAAYAAGCLSVDLRPGTWIRRHTIYLYAQRDGQILTTGSEDGSGDVITVTALYQPGGAPPIRRAARITTGVPLTLTYPVPPGSPTGSLHLTALGTVGGKLITASVPVDATAESIYLLVTGDTLRVVNPADLPSESDPVAEQLRAGQSRPLVTWRSAPRAEADREIDVITDVVLIPQPTDVSCWAAALAMVVSARDRASRSAEAVALQAGMDVSTGYGWSQIRAAVNAWNLVEEGPRSAEPAEWARMLEAWGPIWIVEIGAPYHAVVLGGIRGDGTAEGTRVTLYNPWPPGVGVIESKSFLDFDSDFGLGAGAGAAIVHARN